MRVVALKHADGSLTDIQILSQPGHFHPDRGDGSEWIEIDGMPTGDGPWKLQGTTAVLDEVAKAAQEAAESKAALVELFKEKAAIEAAAAAATPSLDFTDELAAVDAAIAAVTA